MCNAEGEMFGMFTFSLHFLVPKLFFQRVWGGGGWVYKIVVEILEGGDYF